MQSQLEAIALRSVLHNVKIAVLLKQQQLLQTRFQWSTQGVRTNSLVYSRILKTSFSKLLQHRLDLTTENLRILFEGHYTLIGRNMSRKFQISLRNVTECSGIMTIANYIQSGNTSPDKLHHTVKSSCRHILNRKSPRAIPLSVNIKWPITGEFIVHL